MTFDSEAFGVLQKEKMKAIQELTELNAQHIKSQSRLSGIEIDTARCNEAIERNESSEDVTAEIKLLNQEYAEIMQTRAAIDERRDVLEQTLQDIDTKLAEPSASS